MFNEYKLTQTTTNLVNAFNVLVKSIHDQQEINQYQGYRSTIEDLFAKLDIAITNANTRATYLGLKNTVNGVVEKLDAGILATQAGNITEQSSDYDTALQQSYFVQQNTASLILEELQDSRQLQADIAKWQLISELMGALLLFVIGAGAVSYSIIFSKRIVSPIETLSVLAKKIEQGDLDAPVDPRLLAGTDEVGSLANSFHSMLQALKSSIHELDAEKKSVEAKVEQRTQELVEERAQLVASVNSLPFGFIMLDSGRTAIMINKIAQELFDGNSAMALEEIAKQLNVEKAMEAAYQMLIETGVAQSVGEATFKERFFKVAVTPIILEGSSIRVIGSVVVLDDITEAKRLEQSKNAFVAIASHEMRTPLTVIRGNAELLVEDPVVKGSDAVRGQIESILKSSVRLLSIVNDFLDVQNMEKNSFALKIEPVDLPKVLEDAVVDLAPLAQKRGLSLTFDRSSSPSSMPTLLLDKYRLQQIITNLISNAIHYTEKGSVEVGIALTADAISVLFKDTGIGINPEDQAHLFKKFSSGKAFLHSREYGSGLGLYISKFLARLMGGDLVLAKSEVGVGSTFMLTIPLHPQGDATTAGVHEESIPAGSI
jgi:signal transduction histidine kinase/HAMP domain-containing protein